MQTLSADVLFVRHFVAPSATAAICRKIHLFFHSFITFIFLALQLDVCSSLPKH